MTALLAHEGTGRFQFAELMAGHAMAMRILDRLPDADAFVAVFISLKTECVFSPLTHGLLVRLASVDWKTLQEREISVLRRMDWRLYDGALTPTISSPTNEVHTHELDEQHRTDLQ